uniref:Protein kinase domain-containing protein n=1 Tax=Ascaris lumbricoides TaxID=6252 RepID=A0A9J2PQA0_ASCLU
MDETNNVLTFDKSDAFLFAKELRERKFICEGRMRNDELAGTRLLCHSEWSKGVIHILFCPLCTRRIYRIAYIFSTKVKSPRSEAECVEVGLLFCGSVTPGALLITGEIGLIHGTWVAYEFVNGSPLSSVLTMRKTDGMPPLTIRANFEIMYQVAAGMRYLEDNGLCHRCLRASNILVSVEHEFALAVRITDYMLPYHMLNDPTQDVDVSELHWKWMGIGALDRLVFDIKADVWSFGCVMFEILNPGLEPYAFEQTPIDSPKSLLKFLSKGKRMTIQKDDDGRVPNFIRTLMSCCWLQQPAQRPTFARIFTFFYDLLFDFANGCNKAICEYQSEKCISRGTDHVACFENGGMHPGDYVWVRMRVAKKCQPKGYAIVQLGHSTTSYAANSVIKMTTSGNKPKAPHWITRANYRPRLQLRISERNGMLQLRAVDHGRKSKELPLRAFYGDRKTMKDIGFSKVVQDEYYDIKIQLLGGGVLSLYFNGEFISQSTPGVGVPHSTHLHDVLNVFEFYRSDEPGYSKYAEDDVVSLESSAYLQPFIAILKSGGLPSGGLVRLGLLTSNPVIIIFVTKEWKEARSMLVVDGNTISWQCPDIHQSPFNQTIEDFSTAYNRWSTIHVANFGEALLGLPGRTVRHHLGTVPRKGQTELDGQTGLRISGWDGEIKRVIVRGDILEKWETLITYADVTNDENPDVLSFQKLG